MHAPERISDRPECLLGGDLAAVAHPAYIDFEKINHGRGVGEIVGMNALYLDGRVTWQTHLPKVVDKGELAYWLPEDIAPSVGRIKKPPLEWPDMD